MNTDELLKLHFEHDDKRFDEINGKLDLLLESHNKQRGFVAGFSAAFSLLATSVIGLGIYIWQKHFGG